MGVDLDGFMENSMWTSYLPAFQSCCGPQQGGVGWIRWWIMNFQATNNFKNRRFEGTWITFNNFVFFNIMSYVGFGEKKPKLETMT